MTLVILGIIDLSLSKSVSDVWTVDLNTVSENIIIDVGTTDEGLSRITSSLLLADLPQALFSFLFLYSNLFTFMYAVDEWHRFAYEQKNLRVSSPIGDQRSTYWLQMPYKGGLPLVATAFIFHWLISESLYFARVAVYDLNGEYVPENDISTIGYSFPPLVLVLCLGVFVVFVFGAGSGFMKFRPGLPLTDGCSGCVVISAACHGVAESEREDDALRPLKWGVVYRKISTNSLIDLPLERQEFWNSKEKPAHCAFGSLELAMPVPGHFYK